MIKRRNTIVSFIVVVAVMFILASCDNSSSPTRTWDSFFPNDTYTHASLHWAIGAPGSGPAINSKTVLSGAQYDAAMDFLVRSSHYMFLERNMGPQFGGFIAAHPKFDTANPWVSAINGRPYAFPNDNPAQTDKRYAVVLSINPNGSINASLGAYWGIVTPEHGDLSDIAVTNAYGWQAMDRPQAFLYFGIGQTVNNIRDRQRATIVVDARGSYEYSGLIRTRYIFMEVRLTHNHRRHMNIPDIFYGLFPGGPVNSVRSMITNNGHAPLLMADEFWGVATGIGTGPGGMFGGNAVNNLNSDEERAAYIAGFSDEVLEIVHNFGVDYQWFEIMQLVAVHENLRFFDGQTGSFW